MPSSVPLSIISEKAYTFRIMHMTFSNFFDVTVILIVVSLDIMNGFRNFSRRANEFLQPNLVGYNKGNMPSSVPLSIISEKSYTFVSVNMNLPGYCNRHESLGYHEGFKKNLDAPVLDKFDVMMLKGMQRVGWNSFITIETTLEIVEGMQFDHGYMSKYFTDRKLSKQNFKIASCDSIASVSFPIVGGHKLKSLKIGGCEKLLEKELLNPSMPAMLELGFLEIGGLKKPISKLGPQNFPPSLVHLILWGGSAEENDVGSGSELSHMLPSSLNKLELWYFEKLESVSMGIQHLTSLQQLEICNCPKIQDLPEKLLPSLLTMQTKIKLN
ncbi:NB-ARC domains-containing protein [Tanacetum coccineum]